MLISTCINYILREIDKDIIRYVLSPGDRLALSVDQLIKSQILDPVLLMDMNLVGGKEVVVESNHCRIIDENDYMIIYHVPKALLGGKRILNVLSAHNEYASVLSDRQDSLPAGITDIEHLGGNNIILRMTRRYTLNLLFRLNVEYSDNHFEINRKAYPTIAEGAVLAAKMVLYTKSKTLRNKPMFSRGMTMDDIKSELDNYSGAAEEYREFRKNYLKYTLIHADKIKKERHLKLITPANIR